jgi:hypothetical protein
MPKENTDCLPIYSPLLFWPSREEDESLLKENQDAMSGRHKFTFEDANEDDSDECLRSRRMLIEEQRSWQEAKRSALVEKFARVVDPNGPYIIRARPAGGQE